MGGNGKIHEIHLEIFLKNEVLSEIFKFCLCNQCEPVEIDWNNLGISEKQKQAELDLTRERAIRAFLMAQQKGEITILPEKEMAFV